MSSTDADAVVAVDRWLAELEGSVSGPGLAVDGKRPVWHHLLVFHVSFGPSPCSLDNIQSWPCIPML